MVLVGDAIVTSVQVVSDAVSSSSMHKRMLSSMFCSRDESASKKKSSGADRLLGSKH